MVEPTKTKTREDIMENSWVRDVIGPLALIIPAILILYLVYQSSIIPKDFKPFVLASGSLVVAAVVLEVMIIIAKIADVIASQLIKYGKRIL